ncbi:MAG: HIT domain-containing protein, partial [Patescibacteria group bacterium]
MNKDCVFCKIVKGELPAKFIVKEKDFVCFMNIHPMAPVHVLIIPKKHIKNLSEVKESDKDILAEIQISIPKIAKKLGISESFRLLSASGKNA